MKNYQWTMAAMLAFTSFTTQASCDSVKAEIRQKIINNGVPESGFTLTVLPDDRVADGQVVGHCENDTQKIIYQRIGSTNEQPVPASTGTSQDAPTS